MTGSCDTDGLDMIFFGVTLLAGTKSKRGNKYAEVFVTKFGWSCAFPMAKKGCI